MLDTIIFDNDIILSNRDAYSNFSTGLKFIVHDNIPAPSSLATGQYYGVRYVSGWSIDTPVWADWYGFLPGEIVKEDDHWTFSWNTSALSIPKSSGLQFGVVVPGESIESPYLTMELPLTKPAGGEDNIIEVVKKNNTALPVVNKAVDVLVPIVKTISVDTTGWSGSGPYTKTVSVSGLKATDKVAVNPQGPSLAVAIASKIYCSAQAAGSLTFTCTNIPTAAVIFDAWVASE